VHAKKHLSFTALRKAISQHFRRVDDPRHAGSVDYSIHDCLMSSFAMMFFQDPSLLSFRRRLAQDRQLGNLKTVFGIDAIPQDTQLRDNLDSLALALFDPIFKDLFSRLQRGKHLADYGFLDGKYLVAIDGSEYFSSDTIHCPSCLRTESKKGSMRYHHQILQAVVVHPDKKQVIPLSPEPIRNTDGRKKQDCEINAAKRKVAKIRTAHPKLDMIITGDGLFSKQPFVDVLKQNRMSFILVAKPADHKVLFEWADELMGLNAGGHLEASGIKGRTLHYQWVNDVPLNGTRDADSVNFFQFQIRKDGKVTYRNSWVTDIAIDQSNIEDLVRAGRARWKIENETFNTLKNQGYHIEHNYGHGKQNLSMVFFILNLLAFYLHQILELTDPLYQKCRLEFSSRMEYWNNLRSIFRMFTFRDWEQMLSALYDPPDWKPP
jgi:hypothetical protein